MKKLRLGVNIDHVATIRNARGGIHPDPVAAAILAQKAGADGITAHLREDRRHIRDDDIVRLKNQITLPLNFEMAATAEMLEIAIKNKPNACCIVPEKREEVTTEGGLDILGNIDYLKEYTAKIKREGIRVSMFVDPDIEQIKAAKELNADIVEIHTGAYCNFTGDERKSELNRIIKACDIAENLGIECHAGHGLTFETIADIAKIENVVEVNIGHFLIGESIFLGLEDAIKKMKKFIDGARKG